MTDQTPQASRRDLLKLTAGLGLGTLLAGCEAQPQSDDSAGKRKRLRAAFSNGGLTTTWCKLGYDSAMLWGDLLDVEIVWLDGELNPEKQRNRVDLNVQRDWDFCAFQSLQIGGLEEPAKQLKKRGVPVISMDTLLVERDRLRGAGVWTQIAADHELLAEQSTRYLMEKIGGKGKVIHIGGASAHSGAQERARGFAKVVAQYPGVEVLGGGIRWCDWKTELARNTFETLLRQSTEPIAGAFFHNDDMALASVPALKGTPHDKMVITAVDGQKEGLTGVREGKLAATSVNPTCMIHQLSVIVGQFIVRNQEKVEDLPLEIRLPGPLVSKEAGNLETMLYLSDPKHCIV